MAKGVVDVRREILKFEGRDDADGFISIKG